MARVRAAVMSLEPDVIAQVAAQTRAALGPLVDADWSVPAGALELSCWQVAEHIADSYFAHAARIVGQPTTWFVPAAVRADEGVGPLEMLQVIDACAELLRVAALAADPATRAYHPWGASDPEGSIAMGVVEGLVHTWDIANTLGSSWRPPAELSAAAVARLFPEAPTVAASEAGELLLWCTGRIALPDHELQAKWRWYSAVPDTGRPESHAEEQ